jgi:hypothetical protein
VLNAAGMTCVPVAEKLPTGTIESKKVSSGLWDRTYQGRAVRQMLNHHRD